MWSQHQGGKQEERIPCGISQHFTSNINGLVEEVRDHGQQGRDARSGYRNIRLASIHLHVQGVKLGCALQNSTATEWGGARLGSHLACRAKVVKKASTPSIVVARYGPSSFVAGANGRLSRQLRRPMWSSRGFETTFSSPLKYAPQPRGQACTPCCKRVG